MNILVYRFGNICEPDVIRAFEQIGLSVTEECAEITNKDLTPAKQLSLVENHLKKGEYLFVFSINYFPVIAQVCHIYRIPYLCWTVDCPVSELLDDSIKLNTNRIFLFDQTQYRDFSPYNPSNTYHLPLASAVERFDQVIQTITDSDRSAYRSDISFVGSLYSEKDPLHGVINSLPDFARGYIDSIVETSLKLYGYYPAEDALTPEVVGALKNAVKQFYQPLHPVKPSDQYVAAHNYIGYHIAEIERIRTLNRLAESFDVDLYTRSDVSPLVNVHTHDGVKTLTEMPKIFHLSKINLNMTIKPIQTGLPLRIFDIMGCGGFCMTNYQAELTDYFEIGVDLEAYSDLEELVDKCSYYLQHDDERKKIAENGYEKVKACHQYVHRIKAMIEAVVQQ